MFLDNFIIEADRVLRTLSGTSVQRRPTPKSTISAQSAEIVLSEAEKKHAAGLMRVNHVGEICAQALYQAQRLTSRSQVIKEQLTQAAIEEEDHLAWCASRLKELNSRPSFLNPIWYGGSFMLGVVAGLSGDRWSLGFVAETEKQVTKHLDGHLQTLPEGDLASRAIVEQMRTEESLHQEMAINAGAATLPKVAQQAMQIASRLMTKTAYYV
jgi:ubiquinone biosynthesis monooxygenase Coq7